MADIRTEFKRTARIRCDVVDEVVKSPEERAKKILLLIGESANKTGDKIDNWDLICFSCLTLAGQLEVVPDLKNLVQAIAFKIHEAHYFSGQEFGLYDEDSINAKVRIRRTIPESSEREDNGEPPKQGSES
jgi:hypothetical protein